MSEQDIWIDVQTQSDRIDRKFYGLASVSHPYGLSGQAQMVVKFNLSAYVKHLIAEAKQGE